MKILGTTGTGLIVEIGQFEYSKIVRGIDNAPAAPQVGTVVDVHSVFTSVTAASRSAAALRRAAADMTRAADEIEGAATKVTAQLTSESAS